MGLVESLWQALGLPSEEGQQSIQCARLCQAVVSYVNDEGGTLPDHSDMGCYTINHKTSCDVELRPKELVKKLGHIADDPPPDNDIVVVQGDDGAVSLHQADSAGTAPTALTLHAQARLGSLQHLARRLIGAQNGSEAPAAVTRSSDKISKVVLRIAYAFRFYPTLGSDLLISVGKSQKSGFLQTQAAEDVPAMIGRSNLEAKAWISTVLSELSSKNTHEFRTKWFGGTGSLSEDEVRDRLVKTFNFIEGEFAEGLRYVFLSPGTEIPGSCGPNVAAWVASKFTAEFGEYQETHAPVCSDSDDPTVKQCGLDEQGRYFVYICNHWVGTTSSTRTGTLVHEAVHHSGPRDLEYDALAMRGIPQIEQLHNAASYQHFAQDVAHAAWGCPDSEAPSVPVRCRSPSGVERPCQCKDMASVCEHPLVRQEMHRECPSTCGSCSEPPSCEDKSPLCPMYEELFVYCKDDIKLGAILRQMCAKSCGVCA